MTLAARKGSKLFAVLLICIVCAALVLLGPKQEIVHRGEIFGTTFEVKWFGSSFDSTSEKSKIDLALSRVDQLMSTYKPDSELSKLNQNPSLDWIGLSKETIQVLSEAQKIYLLTDGAFDPTIGPLVELWGFGAKGYVDQPPKDALIKKYLANSGFSKLEIELEANQVRKLDSTELQIDLSAIAKGFAVDEIARLLSDLGHERYMVEVGGEVRVRGNSSLGEGWRIAIARPDNSLRGVDSSAQRIISLRGSAMATSGTYRNYFESGKKFYSHTLDPKTGYPVDHPTVSVTVVAKSCTEADALATAFLVMGSKKALDLAEREGIAVLFYDRAGRQFIERHSSLFEKSYL